jgi:hypothetical protein
MLSFKKIFLISLIFNWCFNCCHTKNTTDFCKLTLCPVTLYNLLINYNNLIYRHTGRFFTYTFISVSLHIDIGIDTDTYMLSISNLKIKTSKLPPNLKCFQGQCNTTSGKFHTPNSQKAGTLEMYQPSGYACKVHRKHRHPIIHMQIFQNPKLSGPKHLGEGYSAWALLPVRHFSWLVALVKAKKRKGYQISVRLH